jgi:hypothetical protein
LSGAIVVAVLALTAALPASSQPKATPLTLSVAQRQIVWDNIWRNAIGAIPIGFEASIGTIVPPAIKLQSWPPPVVDQVPALKPLSYAKSRNQILVVDPITRKVVAVLDR